MINSLSLSLGLAASLLFMMYIKSELESDRFNDKYENIYRVYEWNDADGFMHGGDAGLYLPLGPALKQEFPDVETFVRFKEPDGDVYLNYGGHIVRSRLSFADETFFDVFSFPILYGDPHSATSGTKGVALTREKAEALFGKQDPVGRTISISTRDTSINYIVTAVVANPPVNSSIKFEVLGDIRQYETLPDGRNAVNNWQYSGFKNFVLLKKGSVLPQHPEAFVAFRKKYFPGELEEFIKAGTWNGRGLPPTTFRLQPLKDIHTDATIRSGGDTTMDKSALWQLFSICLCLLLIGCVNFTILAIGRLSRRIKEVGVRKVIGASKANVIGLCLTESYLLTFFSGIAGLILSVVFLPHFDTYIGVRFTFTELFDPVLLSAFLGVMLVTGFLAGIYPAILMTGLKVSASLRGRTWLNNPRLSLKVLMSLQFVLSGIFIVAALVVNLQLDFLLSQYLGFDKENVIAIDADHVHGEKVLPLFIQLLARQSTILGITSLHGKFGDGYNTSGFFVDGKHHTVINFMCDTNMTNVFRMHLLAGRGFNSNFHLDTVNSVIVNRSFASDLGIPVNKIIGMKLFGYSRLATEDPVVVGVVENYNLLPLKQKVEPILFKKGAKYIPTEFYVRFKEGDVNQILPLLRTTWQTAVGNAIPLEYSFLDNDLNARYVSEDRLASIVRLAAAISIFMACLGSAGLALLAATDRLKEMMIRKVFGGSLKGIFYLLIRDFLQLSFIAFCISLPISIYLMQKWLNNYAYRITLKWWIFSGSLALVLLLTFATSIFAVGKIALARPAKVLKVE
jgi:putative ABC transport system permease protein